jgi:dTDP-4-amino-4,6-dideoxygalactose transaminase
MNAPEIPFNRPEVTGRELDYLREALASGHTSSGGPFSRRAGAILQEATGAAEVLLTTSCTDALELSCLLLDLGPGDTVVVPSFTFTSSALAFARQGARILFCVLRHRARDPRPRPTAPR